MYYSERHHRWTSGIHQNSTESVPVSLNLFPRTQRSINAPLQDRNECSLCCQGSNLPLMFPGSVWLNAIRANTNKNVGNMTSRSMNIGGICLVASANEFNDHGDHVDLVAPRTWRHMVGGTPAVHGMQLIVTITMILLYLSTLVSTRRFLFFLFLPALLFFLLFLIWMSPPDNRVPPYKLFTKSYQNIK